MALFQASDYGITLEIGSDTILVVDGVNGADVSAEKGNMSLRYKTISAAEADAVSGDTIVVLPATYTDEGLGKANVNYHFYAGAIVSPPTTHVFSFIFSTISKITGYGSFESVGDAAIYVNHAQAEVDFQGEIISTGGEGIFVENCQSVKIRGIIDMTDNVVGLNISGDGDVNCYANITVSDILLEDSIAVLVDGKTSGDVNLYGNINHFIDSANPNPNSSANVAALVLNNNSNGTNVNVYGLLRAYSDGGVFDNSRCVRQASANGRLNCRGLLISDGLCIDITGGSNYFYADCTSRYNSVLHQNIGDTYFYGSLEVKNEGGTNNFIVGREAVVFFVEGTVRILCAILMQKDNANYHAIKKTGGSVVLDGASLFAVNAGAESISSPAPEIIKVYSRAVANRAINANITIDVGTLTIDANVF